MSHAPTLAVALIIIGASPPPALAFNTYNGTPFPICVVEDSGNLFSRYHEVVKPRSTSQGWYLNSSIRLCTYAFNGLGNDGAYICNERQGTCMDVPPHQQQNVSEALFVVGGGTVGGDGTAVQWGLWGAGYPAEFVMNLD